MTNTVYGPFSATSITNGVTPINKTWGDNAQTQASVALNGINPDLSGPFVLSGITCTKDGTTTNQLDIASGRAYVTMSDGTTGLIVVGADTSHTTSTISTTYYLFLKNDGTWQWSTTSTGPTNSLPICQATTDGSGNISAVTDVRHNAGSPGVPITVARLAPTHVTSTVVQNLLVVPAPLTGFYRATFSFTYLQATSVKPIAWAGYHSAQGALTAAAYFIASGGTPGQALNGSQATAMGTNQDVACAAVTFYAVAGLNLSLNYQENGGTPNTWCYGTIERLS